MPTTPAPPTTSKELATLEQTWEQLTATTARTAPPATATRPRRATKGRAYWIRVANRWNGYDLDCPDLPIRRIPITGSDPNGLDGDGDGIGCEWNP